MKTIVKVIVLLTLAIGAGVLAAGCGKKAAEANATKQYTCPMHPEVVQEGPGKCPKCAMALKPK